MIYYVAYAMLLAFTAASWRNEQVRRPLYFVSIVLLTLFVGLRYEVGCDFDRYIIRFNYSTFFDDFGDLLALQEPGNWLLNRSLHELDLTSQAMFLANAIIFFWGLNHFARRQPNALAYLALSFPFLIMNMPMAAIRQATAMGFMFFAMTAFVDRKLIRFSLAILVGSLFHSSLLTMFVLAPFIVGSQRPRAQTLLIQGLFLLLIAYGLRNTGSAEIAESRYIDSDLEAAGALPRILMMSAVGLLFMILLRNPWREKFPADYMLALISSMAMLSLPFALLVSSVIADRVAYYFMPMQLMILVRLPYLGIRNSPLWTFAPYVVLTAAFIFWIENSRIVERCYQNYELNLELFAKSEASPGILS